MNLRDDWKKCYLTAEQLLLSVGISNVHLEFVLFCMIYTGWSYRDSLAAYADFRHEAPERMHSAMCLQLLKSGLCISPEVLLTKLEKEVEYESGIHVAEGS